MKIRKEYTKYILSLILFGSNGIIAGFISLPSTEIVFWRTMIGSILLVLIYIMKEKKCYIKINNKDVLYVTLSGISMGISWIFLYEAYNLIGVSLSSLAYYCGPVIVMVLSPLLFGEKLTIFNIIGFQAVILGAILVNGDISKNVNNIGVIYGGISAVAHAFMVIFSKKSKMKNGIENAMIQLVFSFFTVVIYFGITEQFSLKMTLSDLFWIVILGVFNTGVGCYLYFSSISKLSVKTVSVFGYIEPLSAVLLAVMIIGERMSVIQIIGTFTLIVGMLFAECTNFEKSYKRR